MSTDRMEADNLPDQLHLGWDDAPATTLSIVWGVPDDGSNPAVEYRRVGTAAWNRANGRPRQAGGAGKLYEARLGNLVPESRYEYRVLCNRSTWSPTYSVQTAPKPGQPADFDAVFVADTGLIGRTDGLATGTQQVIEEVAALEPLVVLAGGDFAYYHTETRFASLEDAIDFYFNQMRPVATVAPLMPTYGNHELLLGEGFEPWADRFPTPDGFEDRRNYSFDVGNVHFVSICAVEGHTELPSERIQWVEQDIIAAKESGQDWIIPFFHVSPFADGQNHPSNLALRGQLGPVFERLDIKLAISTHDQAYERTYPLTDVPSTNTPTSLSKSRYTTSDGVIWLKVSPGGKLSNINGSFSQFATQPPPSWTAVRNNTMHNYARLRFYASGSLQVDAFGVRGDGGEPALIDSFTCLMREVTGS